MSEFVDIALPKGRLGDPVLKMLELAGYGLKEDPNDTRKLTFENREAGIRCFWVKPSDVGIYVERGAADIGVVGKDILTEYEPAVYELLDQGLGKCRMAVAGPKDFLDEGEGPLKVATKFPNVARAYYSSRSREIDVIKLNGSIELAPVLGLSDVIVDIVETGTTLKENGLDVLATVFPISARLIANKASYTFKHEKLMAILKGLEESMR